jgi:hypothetical protein
MNSFLTKPNYYSTTVKNKYVNKTSQNPNSKQLFYGYKKYITLYKLNNLYLSQTGGPCVFRVNTFRRHAVVTYAINDTIDTINEISYYIVKWGLLYVFFYCSLQWFYYRNLRKDNEKKDK